MYYVITILAAVYVFGNYSTDQLIPRLIGTCEGCEAVFEFGDRELPSIDTLPGFEKEGIPICVKGTVYKPDGKTPASGVIFYMYHTNKQGIYQARSNGKGWAKRHGYIRSWLKTDEQGRYSFYTSRPRIYPNRSEPAHIHLTVLEPDGKYYWLGSYYFLDDPLLTDNEINPINPRGGSSGVLELKASGSIQTASRDIILGKNIPGYH